MTSVFERLSQQGTVASKQRDAEERQCRLKKEQRRQKETAAQTPTKNELKLKAMQRSPPIPQDRMKKNGVAVSSPKQRDEVYDRLAKQETISSAAHHASQDNNNSTGNGVVGGGGNSPIRTSRELSQTFNRLYKQDTASSKAHHHKKSLSPKKKKVVSNTTPPPSLLTRRLEDKSSDQPSIPLKMDIYIRTTEQQKSGKPYNTLDIPSNEVRKQINLYATSKISAKALAYDIINALFHRDFTPGRHWDISSATVEEVDVELDYDALMKNNDWMKKGDENDVQVFLGEKEAVWDHKDIYSRAKASAKIMISSEGVYVDEYSFYTAG